MTRGFLEQKFACLLGKKYITLFELFQMEVLKCKLKRWEICYLPSLSLCSLSLFTHFPLFLSLFLSSQLIFSLAALFLHFFFFFLFHSPSLSTLSSLLLLYSFSPFSSLVLSPFSFFLSFATPFFSQSSFFFSLSTLFPLFLSSSLFSPLSENYLTVRW